MKFLTLFGNSGIELQQIRLGRIRDGECGKMSTRQHEHRSVSRQSMVITGKSAVETRALLINYLF